MDLTFTLGNAIQIGVTIVAVFMAYSAIRERLAKIETQIEPMWREFERRRTRP